MNAFHSDVFTGVLKKARRKVTENLREPEIILQRRAVRPAHLFWTGEPAVL